MAEDKPRDQEGKFTQEWEPGEELTMPRTIRHELEEPVPHTKVLTRGMTLQVVKDDPKRPAIDTLSKQIQQSAAQEVQAQIDSK